MLSQTNFGRRTLADELWRISAGDRPNLGRFAFFTLGNLLGLPAVALPMGVVDGLPTGVQIYADRWREDPCPKAAAIIEAQVEPIMPIDSEF